MRKQTNKQNLDPGWAAVGVTRLRGFSLRAPISFHVPKTCTGLELAMSKLPQSGSVVGVGGPAMAGCPAQGGPLCPAPTPLNWKWVGKLLCYVVLFIFPKRLYSSHLFPC